MPKLAIGMNPQAATGRDLRLDFFRGLALIFIFVDHIPRNYFAWFTSQHYGFSDAAEAFVFISGYSAAMVYSAVAQRSGMLFAGVQIWRRMWQLYIAHILLFIVFVAQIAWVSGKFNNAMYVEEMNIVGFLDEPHVAVGQALLLKFKPTNLDILPLYILLLLFFPPILYLLRVSRWLALGASALLYAVTRAFDLSLPAYKVPLSDFWEMAAKVGLVPIIATPDRKASEAWHFECRGSHQLVYDYYRDGKGTNFDKPYKAMAASAIVSVGVNVDKFADGQKQAAIQSGLIRLGQDIGNLDGRIGQKSVRGLDALGIAWANEDTVLREVTAKLEAAFPGEFFDSTAADPPIA